MNDKIALVTGGSRGIGKATAIALAAAGADVAVVSRDLDEAKQVATEIEIMGRRGLAIKADVGHLGDIDLMVDTINNKLGGVDVLVNNAGTTRNGGLLDIDEDTWDSMQRVNAKGTFFCIQRAARQMIKQGRGGRIINISSIGAKGFKGTSSPAYAATKGAVISLTYMAAVQLAPHKINVNAICPGLIETKMMRGVFTQRAAETGTSTDQLLATVQEMIPLAQIGEPQDIAAMVTMLAGPGGQYITGQTINIDGGLVMQ
jgi:NAD(P)-dependent dehydrogenase (short-subunit alcohol dehydrogenase family)